MSSSCTNIGTYFGEKSGEEYSVIQRNYTILGGPNTDQSIDVYSTECGMDLSPPNSDDKLFCSDLNEFLVKK